MPKQIGSRQIRGKFGTECYYFRKGQQVGLYRGINQQMSQRVKTEPNFYLTRLYASEFGYSGELAALSLAATRLCTHMTLHGERQGKLTKTYRQLLAGNHAGAFGSRVLYGLGWQDAIVAKMNEASGVSLDYHYPLTSDLSYIQMISTGQYSMTWRLTWDDSLATMMERNKLDRLDIALSLYGVKAGHYDDESKMYQGAMVFGSTFFQRALLTLDDIKSDSSYVVQFTLGGDLVPLDVAGTQGYGDSELRRPVIGIQAERSIGGRYYDMPSLNAFKVLPQAHKAGN